jgi:hypothetical protein
MDDLPTDEQLRRIEDRVMTRIRRRARLPRQIGATVVAAGLVVGGFALITPALHGVGASSTGGSAGGSGGGSAAVVARCHSGSAVGSTSVVVPLPGAGSAAAAITACRKAEEAGRLRANDRSTGAKADSAARFVVCRDRHKVLEVFVADRAPSTLCKRNGMSAP